MPRKGHSPEQVLNKLRQVEVTGSYIRISAASSDCSWLLVFRSGCYRQSG